MEKVIVLSGGFGSGMCLSRFRSISGKLMSRLNINQGKFGSLTSVFMFNYLIVLLIMGVITNSVHGMDEVFQQLESVRFNGARGDNFQGRLEAVKEGAEIFCKATKGDGKSTVDSQKPVTGPYGATLAPEMPVGAVVVPAKEVALA